MAASTEVCYTQAETEAMMDALPTSTEKRCEVQVTFVFDGVSFVPGTFFDHLKDIGTVQTDKVPARNNFNFVIT